MNTTRRRRQPFVFFLIGMTAISGCATGIPGTTEIVRSNGVEPRVVILDECPKAKLGSTVEASLFQAVGDALVPSIIDTSLTSIGKALQESAKSDTTVASAMTTGRFYSTSPAVLGDSTPFEVRKNDENGCLVVAYGPTHLNDSSSNFSGVFFTTNQQHLLEHTMGLRGDPHYYYEGRFVYSADRTAFRIESEILKFDKLADGSSEGMRDLSLTLEFANTSPSKSSNVFAMSTIAFGSLHTGTTLQKNSGLGTDKATKYSTPWLPLPPVPDSAKALMVEGRAAGENLAKTITSMQQIYVSQVDSNSNLARGSNGDLSKKSIDEFLERIDRTKVKARLDKIDAKIAEVSEEIGNQAIMLDASVVKLSVDLEKERQGLEGAKAIEHARDARIEFLVLNGALATRREDLADYLAKRAELSVLVDARRTLTGFSGTIERSAKRLERFTPFTVSATIEEKREANGFLQFIADVFSSAQPTLSSELKAALDPKTKKELEEKEVAAEAALADQLNLLRKNARLAILAVQGAEIELRLLNPAANEVQQHNAKIKLEKAVFGAVDACHKAWRKSVQPPECSLYL